jgi:maltooligosyltrehalose trehalohydrolase
MTTFRVWAPVAHRVDVEVGGEHIPLTVGEGGWWSADVPTARPENDYAFILDDGEPLPDPRSPWQPYGVHGPSRMVDHQAFPWQDQRWQAGPLSAAVLYELHIGTFTPAGTFEAAIERLDHLIDLGITHVELMPVNEFSGNRGWGYDGVDLYAPHHGYGGPHGLKRLVDACHARGLAVLLDVVYNHLGPAGNYLDRFGPYFTDRYATPWGRAVNLDGPYSHEVRRFFCDNACMWLRDYHVDGLRIDAVHALVDTSAVHFLEQLAAEVDALAAQLGRHLVLIAESDLNDPRVVRPSELGGYGIDAQWNDDFHHALHTVLTGERDGYYTDFGTFADLAKALERAFVYDGRYSAFRRRLHGRPPTGLAGHRFVAYLQNHDQIGNRATGDRSSHLLSTGRLKMAAALVLTSPFIPLLFQGEEWGASSPFQYFTAYDDPVLGQAVANGRREEFAVFGWHPHEVPDPQAHDIFARSKLNWGEVARGPHAELLDWHRRLICLRREVPALADGRLDRIHVDFDEQSRWLVVARGPVAVACNLADRTQHVPVRLPWVLQPLLASDPAVRVTAGGVTLPPDAVALLGPPSCTGVTVEPSCAVAVRGKASQTQVPVIALAGEWEGIFQGEAKAALETLLPEYLQQWRWFGGKARQIRATVMTEVVRFPYDASVAYWAFLSVAYGEGEPETYVLPLTVAVGQRAEEVQQRLPRAVIARVQRTNAEGLLCEAWWDPQLGEALLAAIACGSHFQGTAGALCASPTQVFADLWGQADAIPAPTPLAAEQSNTSVVYGDRFILKLFRRVADGVNPDLELGRFLTEKASFPHIARMAGALEYHQDTGEPTTVGILHGFVSNRGDAWGYTLEALDRYFAAARVQQSGEYTTVPHQSLLALAGGDVPSLADELIGPSLASARLLGQRTAELHLALASDPDNPRFAPEPFTVAYQHALTQSIQGLTSEAFRLLRQRLADLPETVRGEAEQVLALEREVVASVQAMSQRPISALRIRIHGDYHLGQVLSTGDDFVITDFEGEPARPLRERQRKHSPLKDVAGMLRSFHYAAYAGLLNQVNQGASSPSEALTALEPWAQAWYVWVSAGFLQTYLAYAGAASVLPPTREERQVLLDAYLLEKAVYELGYELNNRPDWIRIPLQGIRQLWDAAQG